VFTTVGSNRLARTDLGVIWRFNGIELVPFSVDRNSRKLFSKAKNNTEVISITDSLPGSATPYFDSACECYLLEENHAVFFMFMVPCIADRY